jgi:hypothetical protein
MTFYTSTARVVRVRLRRDDPSKWMNTVQSRPADVAGDNQAVRMRLHSQFSGGIKVCCRVKRFSGVDYCVHRPYPNESPDPDSRNEIISPVWISSWMGGISSQALYSEARRFRPRRPDTAAQKPDHISFLRLPVNNRPTALPDYERILMSMTVRHVESSAYHQTLRLRDGFHPTNLG